MRINNFTKKFKKTISSNNYYSNQYYKKPFEHFKMNKYSFFRYLISGEYLYVTKKEQYQKIKKKN